MKTRRTRRPLQIVAFTLTVTTLLLASACSTVDGLGEDIQSAGASTSHAIQDATGEGAVQNKGSVEGQGANQTPTR